MGAGPAFHRFSRWGCPTPFGLPRFTRRAQGRLFPRSVREGGPSILLVRLAIVRDGAPSIAIRSQQSHLSPLRSEQSCSISSPLAALPVPVSRDWMDVAQLLDAFHAAPYGEIVIADLPELRKMFGAQLP